MSIEKYKIPEERNSDWRDDIDLDFETYGTNKQEMEYISPSDIPKENIEKIKAIDLIQKYKERGQKIGKLFSLESL